MNIFHSEASKAEFHFWPAFDDHTEPDLVIIVGQYYLLFEAKYHSGFGQATGERKHQIAREVQGGKRQALNLGKEFKIIAVTAYYSDKPEIKRDIPPEYRGDLIWTNWQSIAFLVDQQVAKNPGLSSETRLFANDLYELLVRKKLRNFEGLKVLSALPPALRPKSEAIFFEAKTASHRGAFLGFTTVLADAKRIHSMPGSIFWLSERGFLQVLSRYGKLTKPDETLFYEEKE